MQRVRSQSLRRSVLVLALLSPIACVSWRNEPVPAAGSRAAERLPSRVRIVTADGRSTLLWDPYLRNDSIIGTARGPHRDDTVTVRIARADIRALEARRPSAGRSTLLALGAVAVFIALINVLAGGGS
jgi:hypothetical protein